MADPQARRHLEGVWGRAIGEGHHPPSRRQRGDRIQQLLRFWRFQKAGHRQLQQLGRGVGLVLGKEQQERSGLPAAAQLLQFPVQAGQGCHAARLPDHQLGPAP